MKENPRKRVCVCVCVVGKLEMERERERERNTSTTLRIFCWKVDGTPQQIETIPPMEEEEEEEEGGGGALVNTCTRTMKTNLGVSSFQQLQPTWMGPGLDVCVSVWVCGCVDVCASQRGERERERGTWKSKVNNGHLPGFLCVCGGGGGRGVTS